MFEKKIMTVQEEIAKAIAHARKKYPGCSFSVKLQPDGPTIISVKGKDNELRKVIYIKQENDAGGKNNV